MLLVVLYTNQKTRKTKTWKDGFLKIQQYNGFIKGTLLDDKNTIIHIMNLDNNTDYSPGAQINFANWVIVVENWTNILTVAELVKHYDNAPALSFPIVTDNILMNFKFYEQMDHPEVEKQLQKDPYRLGL